VEFLARQIPGIGQQRAQTLVDRFGIELSNIFISGSAAAVIAEVAHMTKAAASEAVAAWKTEAEHIAVTVTLIDCGWSMTQVLRARDHFGIALKTMIAQEPYRLTVVRGIGFWLADAVALRLGLPKNHPNRILAACAHLLRETASSGHCWDDFQSLLAGLPKLPQFDFPDLLSRFESALRAAETDARSQIYRDSSNRCWLRRLWNAQRLVAHQVAQRLARPLPMNSAHQAVRHAGSVTLTQEQQRAVDQVASGTLVILTGGPGTGKTTVVRAIIDTCQERLVAPRIKLAAPTGKAAKRLNESTKSEASTVHRLLEWSNEGPRRTSSNPIEADVVIIDEASMLDIEIAAALFDALPTHCRLLLVGDIDQLPSVGPGQVLADLIAGGVPTARLTIVHRQRQNSLILHGAYAVNSGRTPEQGSDYDREDFFAFAESTPEKIVNRVVGMVSRTIPSRRGISAKDIRVLTPMNKTDCGVHALNARLRDVLNPQAHDKPEVHANGETMRLGDRLIWLTNSTEYDLVNGEELDLVRIEREGRETHVTLKTYDERLIRIPLANCDARLAYACSIHKSQGSEYSAVIVVLHRSAFRMWERRLLYTAITRARNLCMLVGDLSMVQRAVTNHVSSKRRTGLAEDIEKIRQDLN
jgi:exodeoxyribonuclease V alpha subunit